MCGRFTLKTPPAEWGQLLLPLVEMGGPVIQQWQPRYNIAPTQSIVAVVAGERQLVSGNTQDIAPRLEWLRWGLVPGWAADLAVGNSMINARGESVHEKRSFKGPLAERRCLVLADGYYEWQAAAAGKKKQPFWIHQPGEQVFMMAGIWERNRKATGTWVTSCAIITTAASQDVAGVHDRMPVILDEAQAEQWLAEDQSIDQLREYLISAPTGSLIFRPVSTQVNNPRHEGAVCLQAP